VIIEAKANHLDKITLIYNSKLKLMKNAIVLLSFLLLTAYCANPEAEVAKSAVQDKGGAPLPSDSASMAFREYNMYKQRVDSVLSLGNDPRDANRLALGFKLPKKEVAAMAARIQATGYDSVYAMLAIRYDKQNKPYMTVVFQEFTGTATSPGWTFYDYSRPCPPNCPSKD